MAAVGRRTATTPVGHAALARLFTYPGEHLTFVAPPRPARKPSGVLVAQRVVPDSGDQRHTLAQRVDLCLRIVVQNIPGRDQAADRELEHRDAACHQIPQRAVTGLQPQIARIHAVGSDCHEGLSGHLLIAVERLQRCRLAGRVTVEHEDQLAAIPVVVHHQPPQQRQVPIAVGGAAGRDGRRLAGQVHGHHVGVTLDDDGAVRLGNVASGQIEAEQHVGLLVQHRLGGVDVLGFHLVVVEDPPGTEADDLTAAGPDRPQQPTMEAVHRAAATLPGQSGSLELFELETLAQQVFCQGLPS